MEVLPQDIIVNILSRLPPKSIGRSRCVSKPWKSLLSQPHFIKTHLHHTKHLPTTQESLLLSNDGSLYSVNIENGHHRLDEITVFATKLNTNDHYLLWTEGCNSASCDGLILLYESFIYQWFLVNPTTTAIKVLPFSPFVLDNSFLDTLGSFTMCGLGYDSVNDDYKVVHISFIAIKTCKEHDETKPHCDEAFVDVYSVKNGAWKKAESSPYDHSACYFNRASGVFVNGYIHWLVGRFSENSFVIAAFDLGKERFREVHVPLPTSVDREKIEHDILVGLKGCLCLVPSDLLSGDSADVWMMKEYGVKKSWTKIRILNPDYPSLRPLYMVKGEQLVMVKHLDMFYHQQLLMYNLEEGTFKDIVIHDNLEYFAAVGTFVESLVSPHCSNI